MEHFNLWLVAGWLFWPIIAVLPAKTVLHLIRYKRAKAEFHRALRAGESHDWRAFEAKWGVSPYY